MTRGRFSGDAAGRFDSVADRSADIPAVARSVPEDAVAAVFARAAELDLKNAPGGAPTLLDEDALVEIGTAVGLSPDAVRRALAEHHAGALVAAAAPPGTWVGPRLAVAERLVEGAPDKVRRAVERDLEREWFRKVRDQGERSVWAARTDLPARVARRVDFRHRLVLQGVSGLVLTSVTSGRNDVAVRIEADPAERRNGLGWVVVAATTGGATAGAVLAVLTGLDTAFLVALPTAGVGAGSGLALALARRAYRSQVLRLADDLEGILDRLERTSR